MMKKLIQIFLSIVFIAIGFDSDAEKLRIVIRTTSGGGIFGFDQTARTQWTDASGEVHVDIKCKDSGFKRCPKDVAYTGDLDGHYTPGEIDVMQQLMDLAVSSVGANNLTGSDAQQIIVTYPDGTTKHYLFEVIWQSTDSNESNSLIEITREEMTI